MANTWEKLAGASSIIVRLSAFVFLRWIPGHHFPRLILGALAVYLAIILAKSERFGRAKLHELFPALFVHEEVIDPATGGKEDVSVGVYYEEPAFYKDEHPFLKTLLCGIPDWRERDFSFVTIGFNVLLGLLTLDLVLRGPLIHTSDNVVFSRVGFVDATSARILVREPNSTKLPLYTYFKAETDNSWTQADKIYFLGSETDFTHPLLLSDLRPDTTYSYTFSNDLNGSFHTAPSANSPASNSLTFLTSSCIKANFPYNPFAHGLSIHGFNYLSKVITQIPSKPAFMLFLGDFIYVDVPQRLSSTIEHYRSEYRRVYASPSWSLPGINAVPWLHTLDDHEIANDWSGGNKSSPFPEASDPFIHYHVSVNPPIPPAAPSGSDTNTTYFQFTRGPASFFLLDTRRYRTNPETSKSPILSSKPLYGSSETSSNPSPPRGYATMLGSSQLQDLLRFLSKPEPAGVHWKIVASSVPFTKNWRFGTSDTWGGFPHERSLILNAMHKAEHSLGVRIIVLSGDRHEFAAIRFPRPITPTSTSSGRFSWFSKPGPPTMNSTTPPPVAYDQTPQSGPHEFSVGPLSMFYLPLRTFKQIDDEDIAIAYFPDGNSKVGVVEIGNMASGGVDVGAGSKNMNVNSGVQQRSWLKYSLWIDGVVKWEYMLTSPGPV